MAAFRIIAGIIASLSLLSFAVPVVGEVVATLPPLFPRQAASSPQALHLPYDEVAFPTSDGLTLRGWYFAVANPDAPAVIYAPATANDQRSGLSLVPSLHAAGYSVLLFSYRGHAQSDGSPFGFTYGAVESEDVDAAVAYLENRGVEQIVAIGHSAGAASSLLSAARNPGIDAVVAVAPFNSVRDVWFTGRPAFVPAFLFDFALWITEQRKGFRQEDVYPLQVVDQIAPRPVLILHGTKDQHITTAQAQELFQAARAPKALWLVEGATHGAMRSPMLDALLPDVIGFMDAALGQDPRQATTRPAEMPAAF